MEINVEFILEDVQYQEVSNGSWNAPMTGHRKRKLNSEQWDYIDYDEFEIASEKYSKKQ